MKGLVTLISQFRDHTERIFAASGMVRGRFTWKQAAFTFLALMMWLNLPHEREIFRQYPGLAGLQVTIPLLVVGLTHAGHVILSLLGALGHLLMLCGSATTFMGKWLIEFGRRHKL